MQLSQNSPRASSKVKIFILTYDINCFWKWLTTLLLPLFDVRWLTYIARSNYPLHLNSGGVLRRCWVGYNHGNINQNIDTKKDSPCVGTFYKGNKNEMRTEEMPSVFANHVIKYNNDNPVQPNMM